MLVKLDSVLFSGLDVKKVVVEVNLSSRGIPSFDIVGLGGRSVEESKHRIKAAIQNSGINFPDKKITVNLAPADIVKEGSFYDLPICVGILSAHLGFKVPDNTIFFGELSLNGEVKYSRGTFLMTMYARESGYSNIFISKEGADEALGVVSPSVRCFPVASVSELVKCLSGKLHLNECTTARLFGGLQAAGIAHTTDSKNEHEFSNYENIVGQEQVKRALTICAAGGHNLIMIGPPGSGKSMGATALSELLPPLSDSEAVEVTKIYSLLGNIPKGNSLIRKRPFRQPHHTSSYSGIIGGGNSPMPGEITLAHNGVLFLDEFSEFNRNVLEALRQPIESGTISLSRSRGTVTYPANFTLVAASNPCPCGFLGDPFHECRCPPNRIEQYKRKMSGPIMDRIDLHVAVRPVEKEKLERILEANSINKDGSSNLKQVRECIQKAREIQRNRFKTEGIFTNSQMNNNHITKYSNLSKSALEILNASISKMNFSARTYIKLIKIARTIADMEGKNEIQLDHMAEAIQYRMGT